MPVQAMFNFVTWFRHVCELVFQRIGACDTRVWGWYCFYSTFILVRICVQMGLQWCMDDGSRTNAAAGVQTGGLHADTGSIIVRVFCCIWSFIRSKRVNNCGISALNFNGQIYNENHSKSVILNNYFHSVFTKDTPNDILVINNSPYPSISDMSP